MPKNYVVSEQLTPELMSQLDSMRDRLRMRDLPHNEKAELIANLEGVSCC